MRVIDLFSGCGGMSLGFENAGFKVIRAYDNWEPAIKVYQKNFNHPIIKKDVATLDKEDLLDGNPNIIIGGPPCQDYSSAGRRDETLGRASLTTIFAEKVCLAKVRWFVMENVELILSSKTLPKAKKIFKENGYGLTQVILDASLCGVPQKRKRYFLIGALGGHDGFLEDELYKNLSDRPMTVYDYLGNELGIEHYYRHPRSYNRRGIFSIYEPSPTIRGVNRPIPPKYKIHHGDTTNDLSEVRPLTTEERARIQTFPKGFMLEGTKTDKEQMIGNAVPVELAHYVAECLKRYINGEIPLQREEVQLSLF